MILLRYRLGENRPTIVYAVSRDHARKLVDCFLAAGVSTAYIDCNTPQYEREAIFARYSAGETRIICNVATLDTGLDLDVRCIVDARPTQSRMRFVQTIGRGLRTADGKSDCLILDHAGNHTRLGMVTEIDVRNLLKGRDEPSQTETGEPDGEDHGIVPRMCSRKKAN
jgi:DNA repair protein RadD